MLMLCPDCNRTIEPDWDRCHSCGALLVKDRVIEKFERVTAHEVTRKSYFWKINFTVASLIAVLLGLPYIVFYHVVFGSPNQIIIGYWHLFGFGGYYEEQLIIAMIHMLVFGLIFNMANDERKSESIWIDTLKKRNVILLVLGAILIGINFLLLIYLKPPQYPSDITIAVPVGYILASLAGTIAIVSGILGVVKIKPYEEKVKSYYQSNPIPIKNISPPKEDVVLQFLTENTGKAFTSASLVNRINKEELPEEIESVLRDLVRRHKINRKVKDKTLYYSI